MGMIKKIGEEYLIYEHKERACLIAIKKEDQQFIKKFWKKNKGKSVIGNDLINAYPLVNDKEQNSLKIDFSEQITCEIQHLAKFE